MINPFLWVMWVLGGLAIVILAGWGLAAFDVWEGKHEKRK